MSGYGKEQRYPSKGADERCGEGPEDDSFGMGTGNAGLQVEWHHIGSANQETIQQRAKHVWFWTLVRDVDSANVNLPAVTQSKLR